MSTVEEKARALVCAGGLLIEIARDESLPVAIRRRAVVIARHFPTAGEVVLEANLALRGAGQAPLVTTEQQASWFKDCRHGALTYGTRLDWPD